MQMSQLGRVHVIIPGGGSWGGNDENAALDICRRRFCGCFVAKTTLVSLKAVWRRLSVAFSIS